MDDEVVVIGEDPPGAGNGPGAVSDVAVVDESGDIGKLPDHAVPQDDGSVLLPLLRPVTLKWRRRSGGPEEEDVIGDLTMHRLTGKAMQEVATVKEGKRVALLLARCTRIPEWKIGPILDRMDAADFTAALQVVDHFTTPGRPTGR